MSSSDSSEPKRPAGVSRRSFVQASVGMGSPLLLPSAQAGTSSLEAYADTTSVKPGGTIEFRARDPKGNWLIGKFYAVTITRMGAPDTVMFTTTAVLYNRIVPSDAYSKGCRWASTYRLSIPTTWPSGVYWATFGSDGNGCCVPFVVRAAKPATGTKILVQVPVTTAQAYNPYGGKSLYEYNSSMGLRASQVSFNRPFSDPWNIGFDGWTPNLVRWLASKGITVDYCTSIDLHADTNLLKGYQLFITAGHDEYWSSAMRKNLDAFVAGGGNAAILGGNTCWWQVRFDATGGTDRTMVCYKSASLDKTNGALETINWQDIVPANPENTTTGLSFLRGASWTNAQPRPPSPFVVQQPSHWAFAGLNFTQNVSFGSAYVGYETDAADFRRGTDGCFYPTGLDGTPPTLRILAQADASNWDAQAQALGFSGERSGYAAIGVFSRGGKQGTVFNAGTTDWTYGLAPELAGQAPTPISTITLNVIRKLSSAWSETAEVRQFSAKPASGPAGHYYTIGTETPAGMTLDGGAFSALAAPAAGTTPVYRFYGPTSGPANGKRYHYSTDPAYLSSLGWVADGIAFHAYSADGPGLRAVYQFRTQDIDGNTVLFFSTDINGAPDWTADSPAFFVPA